MFLIMKPSSGPYQAFKKHRMFFSVTHLFSVLDKGQMMALSAETCCLFSRFILCVCVWLILRNIFVTKELLRIVQDRC